MLTKSETTHILVQLSQFTSEKNEMQNKGYNQNKGGSGWNI